MGIRSLCAAAVVAVVVGSSADAATVTHNIIFTVTRAVDIYDPIPSGAETVETPLVGFWGFETGSPVKGSLTVTDECFGNGCPLVKLVVAGSLLYDDAANGTLTNFEGIQGFSGYLWQAIEWNGSEGLFQHTFAGDPDFTLADASISLAAVPLPAPAALLSVGLGALAMMRRRRRSVS